MIALAMKFNEMAWKICPVCSCDAGGAAVKSASVLSVSVAECPDAPSSA